MKKLVIIVALLEEDPDAYRIVTNADIEEGLMEEVASLPYVARVEKVTVLEMEEGS